MHPAVEEMIQFFEFKHLPGDLQPVSQRFHELAHWIANNARDCAEKTAGLRKLLEAKDCVVRSFVPKKKDA